MFLLRSTFPARILDFRQRRIREDLDLRQVGSRNTERQLEQKDLEHSSNIPRNFPHHHRIILERHILNSVEEFHARIEELELDLDDRLITVDVKDFFVVGDHWNLARMAASILEPKDRNVTEKVILFLLRNQFVTSTLSESG